MRVCACAWVCAGEVQFASGLVVQPAGNGEAFDKVFPQSSSCQFLPYAGGVSVTQL